MAKSLLEYIFLKLFIVQDPNKSAQPNDACKKTYFTESA